MARQLSELIAYELKINYYKIDFCTFYIHIISQYFLRRRCHQSQRKSRGPSSGRTCVEGPVEIHMPQHLRVDLGVGSALGLAQAVGAAAALRLLLEAGEALGLVEVEVLVRDDALEAQEVLHAAQLAGRVAHQALAAPEEHLAGGKWRSQRSRCSAAQAVWMALPRAVPQAPPAVPEGQALEAGDVGPLGEGVCV